MKQCNSYENVSKSLKTIKEMCENVFVLMKLQNEFHEKIIIIRIRNNYTLFLINRGKKLQNTILINHTI